MIMKFYRVSDMKYENEYCMSDIECIRARSVTRSPIFKEDALSALRESGKKVIRKLQITRSNEKVDEEYRVENNVRRDKNTDKEISVVIFNQILRRTIHSYDDYSSNV